MQLQNMASIVTCLHKIYAPLSILLSEVQFCLGCKFNYILGKGPILLRVDIRSNSAQRNIRRNLIGACEKDFFLYVVRKKRPRKATVPLTTSVSYL